MSHRARAHIRREFRQVKRLAMRITFFLELAMADVKALNEKIAQLSQFVEDDETQDDANEAALNAVIVDLRAQVAAGNPDLQPQIDALDAVIAKLHTPAPNA